LLVLGCGRIKQIKKMPQMKNTLIFLLGSISTRLVLFFLLLLVFIVGANLYLTTQLEVAVEAVDVQAETLEKADNLSMAMESFARMKYWYAELANSLAAQSEENAKEAKDALFEILTEIEAFASAEVAEMRALVATVEESSLSALDAYFDEDRDTGNALMQKSQEAVVRIDAIFNKLLTQTNTEVTDAATTVQNKALEAEKLSILISLGSAAAVIAILGLIYLMVMRPIGKITSSMRKLSSGDLILDLPRAGDHNEVGQMVKALELFRDNIVKSEILMAEQMAEEQQRAERSQKVQTLAQDFDGKVSKSLAQSNMEMVASATAELSASISEIREQVAHSASIAERAFSSAQSTKKIVTDLVDSSRQVGEVSTMINDISERINLLALNAAIEAARAGESGRGFAVVADEVKKLSGQTASATQEIENHILSMQKASEESVETIDGICKVIEEINEISSSLSLSFEEQTAATNDISQNVEEQVSRFKELKEEIEGFLLGIRGS
jgi:methyl-accepting chemotaxis protein